MPINHNKNASPWIRNISVGMSIVFLYVHVVYGAIEPTKSFWEQRKESAQKLLKNKSLRIQENTSAKVPLPNQDHALLAQLPSINLNVLPNHVPNTQGTGSRFNPTSSSLIRQTADFKKDSSIKLPNRPLPEWLQSVPMSAANLKEMYLPPSWKPSDLMVIHIQDAHDNYEAQSNIAKVIESLGKKKLPSSDKPFFVVGIEGAKGALNFVPYRSFPDKQITKEIADAFLKESLITGPEYMGMTFSTHINPTREGETGHKSPILFWGVEEETLYLNHLQSFKDSVSKQDDAKKTLQVLKSHIADLKKDKLNPVLKALDSKITMRQKGQIGLGKYLEYLSSVSSPLRKDSPIGQFLFAFSLEKSLDYKLVEKERKNLTAQLANKLPKAELKNLVSASLSYRLGNFTHGAFYQYLKELCKAYGLDIGQWKEMEKYIQYVLASEKIKAGDLFTEIESLQRNLLRRSIKDPLEKAIIELSEDMALADKLVEYGLSPLSWKTYQSRKRAIHRIPKRIQKIINSKESAFDLSQHLEPFEKFNGAAIARNTALVTNLLNKVSKTNTNPSPQSEKIAVLVTGGFHTEGMTELLRRKKIAYTVFMPRLGKVEGSGTHYLDVFHRDKTPLEKLFTGERITLARQSGSARSMGPTAHVVPSLERGYSSTALARYSLKQLRDLGHSKDLRKAITKAALQWIQTMGKQGFQTITNMQVTEITPPVRSKDGRTVREVTITVSFNGTIDGKENDIYLSLKVQSKASLINNAVILAEIGNDIITVNESPLNLFERIWIRTKSLLNRTGKYIGSNLNVEQIRKIVQIQEGSMLGQAASMLGSRFWKQAAVLETGFFIPVVITWAKSLMKVLARRLFGNNERLMAALEDTEPPHRISQVIGTVGSAVFIVSWLVGALVSGTWVIAGPLAIGVWMVSSAVVFALEHPDRMVGQKVILGIVGSVLAGVMVAPAVLVAMGISLPVIGTSLVGAIVAGLTLNIGLHFAYNALVIVVHRIGLLIEIAGYWLLRRGHVRQYPNEPVSENLEDYVDTGFIQLVEESLDGEIISDQEMDAIVANWEEKIAERVNSDRILQSKVKIIFGLISKKYLLPNGYIAEPKNRGPVDERNIVLAKIDLQEQRLTDQGNVKVFSIRQVTEYKEFNGSKLRLPSGWSGVDTDHVFINPQAILRDYKILSDRVEGINSPRPIDQQIPAMVGLIQHFLKKGFEKLSEAQRITLLQENTIIHEVEHERRKRMANILDGFLDYELVIHEEIGRLREMIEEKPSVVIGRELETVRLGYIEYIWKFLGRLTGLPYNHRKNIVSRLEEFKGYTDRQWKELAQEKYDEAEKEWERLHHWDQPRQLSLPGFLLRRLGRFIQRLPLASVPDGKELSQQTVEEHANKRITLTAREREVLDAFITDMIRNDEATFMETFVFSIVSILALDENPETYARVAEILRSGRPLSEQGYELTPEMVILYRNLRQENRNRFKKLRLNLMHHAQVQSSDVQSAIDDLALMFDQLLDEKLALEQTSPVEISLDNLTAALQGNRPAEARYIFARLSRWQEWSGSLNEPSEPFEDVSDEKASQEEVETYAGRMVSLTAREREIADAIMRDIRRNDESTFMENMVFSVVSVLALSEGPEEFNMAAAVLRDNRSLSLQGYSLTPEMIILYRNLRLEERERFKRIRHELIGHVPELLSLSDEVMRAINDLADLFKERPDEEKKDRESRGGIMPWVKAPVVKILQLRMSPEKASITYDLKIAFWLENLIAFVGGSLVGVVAYFLTGGDISLALKASYFAAWPMFVILHFFKGSAESRAPPINIALATLIALVNIVIGFYTLGFAPLGIDPITSLPSVNLLIASLSTFAIHAFVNIIFKDPKIRAWFRRVVSLPLLRVILPHSTFAYNIWKAILERRDWIVSSLVEYAMKTVPEEEVGLPRKPEEIQKDIDTIVQQVQKMSGRSVIFLGGRGGSGKSTLSKTIVSGLKKQGRKGVILLLDNYSINRSEIPKITNPLTGRKYKNLGDPKSQRLDLAAKDIKTLLEGRDVELPLYDYHTGKSILKSGKFINLGEDDVLIIDSVHALHPDIQTAAQGHEVLNVFIQIPLLIRLFRSIIRNLVDRNSALKMTIHRWPINMRRKSQSTMPKHSQATIVLQTNAVGSWKKLRRRVEFELAQALKQKPTTEAKRKLAEYFREVVHYTLEYEISSTSEDEPEARSKESRGGIMPWVKAPVVKLLERRMSPQEASRIYDLRIAFWLENFIAFLVGGILLGVPAYLFTGGNISLALKVSYFATWPMFVILHFFKGSAESRGPPINIDLATLIALLNIVIGFYTLGFTPLGIDPLTSLPSVNLLLASSSTFVTHAFTNVISQNSNIRTWFGRIVGLFSLGVILTHFTFVHDIWKAVLERRDWVVSSLVEYAMKNVPEEEVGQPRKPAKIKEDIDAIVQQVQEMSGRSVVFMGGPTNSGKSTLSKNIISSLKKQGRRGVVLSLARYEKNRSKISRVINPLTGKKWKNFSDPESFHRDLAARDIKALLEGRAVELPKFNYAKGKSTLRSGEMLRLGEDDVLIIDSRHALLPDIRSSAHGYEMLKVFVHAPVLVRLFRAIIRDLASQHRYSSFKTTIYQWPIIMQEEIQSMVTMSLQADMILETNTIGDWEKLRRRVEFELGRVLKSAHSSEKKTKLAYYFSSLILFIMDQKTLNEKLLYRVKLPWEQDLNKFAEQLESKNIRGGTLYIDPLSMTSIFGHTCSEFISQRYRMITASLKHTPQERNKWLHNLASQSAVKDYQKALSVAVSEENFENIPGARRLLEVARSNNIRIVAIPNYSDDFHPRVAEVIQSLDSSNTLSISLEQSDESEKAHPSLPFYYIGPQGKDTIFPVLDGLGDDVSVDSYRGEPLDSQLEVARSTPDHRQGESYSQWEITLTNILFQISELEGLEKVLRINEVLDIIISKGLNRHDFIVETPIYQYLSEIIQEELDLDTFPSPAKIEPGTIPTIWNAYFRIFFPFNYETAISYYSNGSLNLTKPPYQISSIQRLNGAQASFMIDENNMFLFLEPFLTEIERSPPDIIVLIDLGARPFYTVLSEFIRKKGLPTRLATLPVSIHNTLDTEDEIFYRLQIGRVFDETQGQLREIKKFLHTNRRARNIFRNLSDQELVEVARFYSQFFPLSSDSRVFFFDDNAGTGGTLKFATRIFSRLGAKTRSFVPFVYAGKGAQNVVHMFTSITSGNFDWRVWPPKFTYVVKGEEDPQVRGVMPRWKGEHLVREDENPKSESFNREAVREFRRAIGGIMPWVKAPVVRILGQWMSPEEASRTYDLGIAFWLENFIAFAGGSLAGVAAYFITGGDISLALRVSYFAAWPMFVILHFFKGSAESRAPPINIALATLIALVNIVIGFYTLGFAPLAIDPITTLPIVNLLIASISTFVTHALVNFASDFLILNDPKISEDLLEEKLYKTIIWLNNLDNMIVGLNGTVFLDNSKLLKHLAEAGVIGRKDFEGRTFPLAYLRNSFKMRYHRRSDRAAAIKHLIEAGAVEKRDFQREKINLNDMISDLKSGDPIRISNSAHAIRNLLEAEIIEKKDLENVEIPLDEIINNFISADPHTEPTAEAVTHLFEAGMIEPEDFERITVPLEQLINELKSTDQSTSLAVARLINILLRAEIIQVEDFAENSITSDDLIHLLKTSGFNVSTIAETIKYLIDSGIIKQEYFRSRLREISDYLTDGLKSNVYLTREVSAEALKYLVQAGVIQQEDIKREYISIDELINSLKSDNSFKSSRIARAITHLIEAGIIQRRDFEEREIPLSQIIANLVKNNLGTNSAQAELIKHLIDMGLVDRYDEIFGMPRRMIHRLYRKLSSYSPNVITLIVRAYHSSSPKHLKHPQWRFVNENLDKALIYDLKRNDGSLTKRQADRTLRQLEKGTHPVLKEQVQDAIKPYKNRPGKIKLFRMNLIDTGGDRSNFPNFMKSIFNVLPPRLHRRPRGLPTRQPIDSQDIPVYSATHSNNGFVGVKGKSLSLKEPTHVYGRTMEYKHDGKALHLKLMRKGEDASTLAYEHDMMGFLKRMKKRWKLKGYYPEGKVKIGRIRIEDIPAELLETENLQGKDGRIELDTSDGYVTFMAYEIEGVGERNPYYTYLNDHDLSHDEFEEGFKINVHDRFVMASHGLFDLEIIELFHSEGQSDRQYDPMVTLSGSVSGLSRGTGEIDNVTKATLYPNVRLSGPADLAAVWFIDDLIDEPHIRAFADQRIKNLIDIVGLDTLLARNYIVSALLQDTLLALDLMLPTYLERREELVYETERDQEHTFLQQNIRSLYEISYSAYNRGRTAPYEALGLDLNYQLMAMQKAYVLSNEPDSDVHRYRDDIIGHTIPQELFPGTDVDYQYESNQRSWTYRGWDIRGYNYPGASPYTIPTQGTNPIQRQSRDSGPANSSTLLQQDIRGYFIASTLMTSGEYATSNLPETPQTSTGGIMPWVKAPVVRLLERQMSPEDASKTYDLRIAFWLENIIAFVGGSLVGVVIYFITGGDISLAVKTSYFAAWPLFVAMHFFKGSAESRAPPINIALAILIALLNIVIGFYILGFAPLAIDPITSLPSVNLIAAFLATIDIHALINSVYQNTNIRVWLHKISRFFHMRTLISNNTQIYNLWKILFKFKYKDISSLVEYAMESIPTNAIGQLRDPSEIQKDMDNIIGQVKELPDNSIVIIVGPSGSGKTTFTENISRILGQKGVQLIIDRYLVSVPEKPKAFDPVSGKTRTLYSHPESFNLRLASNHISALLRGETIELPDYDRTTETSILHSGKSLSLGANSILIIDNVFALSPEIQAVIQGYETLKVFVHSPPSLRLLRRFIRDKDIKLVPLKKTIWRWPIILQDEIKFIIPTNSEADIILDTNGIDDWEKLRRQVEYELAQALKIEPTLDAKRELAENFRKVVLQTLDHETSVDSSDKSLLNTLATGTGLGILIAGIVIVFSLVLGSFSLPLTILAFVSGGGFQFVIAGYIIRAGFIRGPTGSLIPEFSSLPETQRNLTSRFIPAQVINNQIHINPALMAGLPIWLQKVIYRHEMNHIRFRSAHPKLAQVPGLEEFLVSSKDLVELIWPRKSLEQQIMRSLVREVRKQPKQRRDLHDELLPALRKGLLEPFDDFERLNEFRVSEKYEQNVRALRFLKWAEIFSTGSKDRKAAEMDKPKTNEGMEWSRMAGYASLDEMAEVISQYGTLYQEDRKQARASIGHFNARVLAAFGSASHEADQGPAEPVNVNDITAFIETVQSLVNPKRKLSASQLRDEVQKAQKSAIAQSDKLRGVKSQTVAEHFQESNKTGTVFVNLFDFSQYSSNNLSVLAQQIRLAYHSASGDSREMIYPIITNRNFIDVAKLKKRLQKNHPDITDTMLKRVRFGEVVITRWDLIHRQAVDPLIRMNTEEIFEILKKKTGKSNFNFQLFTDNLSRFEKSRRLMQMRIIIIQSATRIVEISQDVWESFKDDEVIGMQQ